MPYRSCGKVIIAKTRKQQLTKVNQYLLFLPKTSHSHTNEEQHILIFSHANQTPQDIQKQQPCQKNDPDPAHIKGKRLLCVITK